jgi:hypothetical protein
MQWHKLVGDGECQYSAFADDLALNICQCTMDLLFMTQVNFVYGYFMLTSEQVDWDSVSYTRQKDTGARFQTLSELGSRDSHHWLNTTFWLSELGQFRGTNDWSLHSDFTI